MIGSPSGARGPADPQAWTRMGILLLNNNNFTGRHARAAPHGAAGAGALAGEGLVSALRCP
jgi:hypothetical protein